MLCLGGIHMIGRRMITSRVRCKKNKDIYGYRKNQLKTKSKFSLLMLVLCVD